jgi:hypothetical protein
LKSILTVQIVKTLNDSLKFGKVIVLIKIEVEVQWTAMPIKLFNCLSAGGGRRAVL